MHRLNKESSISTIPDATPLKASELLNMPTLALALPLMNTILELHPSTGNPDTATLSLIYTAVCCTLPFVAYGVYRTIKGIKHTATTRYRNRIIRDFTAGEAEVQDNGLQINHTLDYLLSKGGWDRLDQNLRDLKQYKSRKMRDPGVPFKPTRRKLLGMRSLQDEFAELDDNVIDPKLKDQYLYEAKVLKQGIESGSMGARFTGVAKQMLVKYNEMMKEYVSRK